MQELKLLAWPFQLNDIPYEIRRGYTNYASQTINF